MGFQVQKTVYRLTFDDAELAGLEVRAKSITTKKYLEMSEVVSRLEAMDTPDADGLADVNRLFEIFVGRLVSWNLEDEDGTPIPATVDGLLDQDIKLVLVIVRAWLQAVAGVAPPLPQASNAGATFQEASLPMVV